MALPKTKSEAKATGTPAWHPNFRNYEQLPDLKVVRTAFFINGLAVLVAVAALLYFVYQEFQITTLRAQIEDWDNQVQRDRVASGQAVAAFRKFQAAEKQVKEAADLMTKRHDLSVFLLHLGETLPDDIALVSLDRRPTRIALTATVRGAPELASGLASQYVAQLAEDAVIGSLFSSVTMSGLARDAESGRITIEITLTYAPEPKS
jgi:Tfp pilus assembly protein PilN